MTTEEEMTEEEAMQQFALQVLRFMNATNGSFTSVQTMLNTHKEALDLTYKRILELEATVQSRDNELAAMNTLITDLMHKVNSSDADVILG